MEKNKDLERYIDSYIEYLKIKQQEESLLGRPDEEAVDDRLKTAYRNNQRRFEYDYEEDFYEPIYEDDL